MITNKLPTFVAFVEAWETAARDKVNILPFGQWCAQK